MKCQYCGKEENDSPLKGEIVKVNEITWFDPDGEDSDYVEVICEKCQNQRPPQWMYRQMFEED